MKIGWMMGSSLAGLGLLAGLQSPPPRRWRSSTTASRSRMLIGGGVGGGYDIYFRALARHIGKHIPGNPTIIAEEPAGGVRPRRGRGALHHRREGRRDHRRLPQQRRRWTRCSAIRGARYDALKLNWLGSIGKLQNVCATWHTSPIKTIAQAREREVIVGAAGATSNTAIMPKVLNALLGTRFKVIAGYDPGAGLTCRSSAARRKASAACRGRP